MLFQQAVTERHFLPKKVNGMVSITNKSAISFIAGGCIIGFFAIFFWPRNTPVPGDSVSKQVKYQYNVRNITNRPVFGAKLWTYAPISNACFQFCDDIQSNHAFTIQTDDLGNQVLLFSLDLLPPYASRTITITAKTTHYERPQKYFSTGQERYLLPEPFIESNHPDIIKLAAQLKHKKSKETARNIFNWVSANIRYSGYIKNSKGALHTLKTGHGDCTEFMYLFIALCRADKLPARGVSGYRCQGNCILKTSDHHNWAQVFLDGVWVLADCQEKVFAKDAGNYIAMNIIPGPNDTFMKGYQRFRYQGDGISVRMNH